jgi:hypothetical protein
MGQTWKTGLLALVAILGLALGLALGCGGSSATDNPGYYAYYHPQGWIDTHASQAMADLSRCTTCHEMSPLRVGNGVPSCMASECHHKSTPHFADAPIHGAAAKRAFDSTGGGLVSCQLCHGQDFSGGPSGISCQSCHGVPAPHPQNWRSKTSLDPNPAKRYIHSSKTSVTNAPVCYQCHYWAPGLTNPNNVDRATNPVPSASMQAPGTGPGQPGCYAGSMCHDNKVAGHPVPFGVNLLSNKGNLHYDSKDAATSQATNAAMFTSDCSTCHSDPTTAPSPTPGAPACQVCHAKASPIAAGTDRGTCLSCHSTTRTTMLAQGPRGTVYPDLPGHHSKHFGAGSDVGLTSCSDCHLGAEWGTQVHYDAANKQNTQTTQVVIFSSYITSQSPGAVYNPSTRTCALTCHGPRGETHTHQSDERW